MTIEEAKRHVLERSEELVRHEMARMVRQVEEEAQTEAKQRARNLVADSLQRVAASHAAETTVSLVQLPSDDMKGRIIGREGRNIRALENLTGVDFIIDDTPQAVVLSSFDGMRREVAKQTLLKLVEDGRIHPARIEEMFYQSKAEIEEHVHQAGEQAVFEANFGQLHDELIKVLGRLRYRTSYGQNVLKHSLEFAHLAGIMAAELGVSVKTAKRAALLHDIGKAMTHEVEGPHAAISAQLAQKYGESQQSFMRSRPTTTRYSRRPSRPCWSSPPMRSPRRARERAARASSTTSSASRPSRRSRREEGSRAGVRPSGRTRDPSHGQAHRGRRRRRRPPLA